MKVPDGNADENKLLVLYVGTKSKAKGVTTLADFYPLSSKVANSDKPMSYTYGVAVANLQPKAFRGPSAAGI